MPGGEASVAHRPEDRTDSGSRVGRTHVRRLGPREYVSTWEAMRAFTAARTARTDDEIWLTEHPPVYTVGVAGRAEHLPRGDTRIPVVRTDRGGQITYHGPGQAMVYALLDLRRLDLTVRTLVRTLEGAVLDFLKCYGIAAQGDPSRPGVYVGAAKVAALGLKIRQGCCYHGLSVNVDMDTGPFLAIDPCGHPGLPVVTLRDLGIVAPVERVADAIAERLIERLHP